METSSLFLRTAQVVGITGPALFAGSGITYSLVTIPAILKAPTPLLLQQWRSIFTTGATIGPPLAIISFLNLGYVAYTKRNEGIRSQGINSNPAEWKAYAFCGLVTLAVVPFTLLFINGTNSILLAESASDAGKKSTADDQVRELVMKWGRFNALRSFFPVIGVMVVLWSALR